MDFGMTAGDILLSCGTTTPSQQSQFAECLENLESRATGIPQDQSLCYGQSCTIKPNSIPTWLSSGVLGTSTSDVPSTGALPPVSELRPGIRSGGGLQLWTLSAQTAYRQRVPNASSTTAVAQKQADATQVYPTVQEPIHYHMDALSASKIPTIAQDTSHNTFHAENSYSYSELSRSDMSAVEALSSLESSVDHIATTQGILDVDAITSSYQNTLDHQYSCIPMLNIPDAQLTSEEQSTLDSIVDNSLFGVTKPDNIASNMTHVLAPRQMTDNLSASVSKLESIAIGKPSATLPHGGTPIDSVRAAKQPPPVSKPNQTVQGSAAMRAAPQPKQTTLGCAPTEQAIPHTAIVTAAVAGSRKCFGNEATSQLAGKRTKQSSALGHGPSLKASKRAFSATSLVEEVTCFRCRLCSFLHQDREQVLKHVNLLHRDGNDVPALRRHEAIPSLQALGRGEKRFLCGKCRRGFVTLDECCRHLSQVHKAKSKKVRLEWVYTNQPDQMRAATPAGESTFLETRPPTPQPLSADAPPPAALEQAMASQPRRKEPGGKKKAPGGRADTTMSSSQKAWRRKVNLEQGSFICERKGCNVRFRELENLEYHVRCHRVEGGDFVCPECEMVCLRWRTMTGHLWRQHLCDMELYRCDQCDFRTFSLSRLENLHKRIHGEERPFLCDCGKSFKTNKQLRNHKAVHVQQALRLAAAAAEANGEGDMSRSETCGECGRRFRGRRLLRDHRNSVHRKLRPFLCSYCGHRASSQSSLTMHLRQHTGEKPFACNLCDYSTGDHNSLRRHKMRHSGDRPYKCPHCPYACIQSSTFKGHLHSKHPGLSDSLLFSCSKCPFQTVREDNFKAHLVIHTEVADAPDTTSPFQDMVDRAPADSASLSSSRLSLGQIVGLAQSSGVS